MSSLPENLIIKQLEEDNHIEILAKHVEGLSGRPWSFRCLGQPRNCEAMMSLLKRLINKIYRLKKNSQNAQKPLDEGGEKAVVRESFTSTVSHRGKRPSRDTVPDNSYLHTGKKTDSFGWVSSCRPFDQSKAF